MPDPVMLGGPRMPDPVDVPLPYLVMESFSWRLTGNMDKTKWTLRFTAAMQVGPNEFAPTSDHHTDVVFGTPHMIRAVALFVENCDDDAFASLKSLFEMQSQMRTKAYEPGPDEEVLSSDEIALEDAPEPKPVGDAECPKKGEHEPHVWDCTTPGFGGIAYCSGRGL